MISDLNEKLLPLHRRGTPIHLETRIEVYDASVTSVADPGSGAFLSPGSGMGIKSGSGSGIRDEQPGSYFLELRNHFFGSKIFKFFYADSGSGM